MRELMKGDRAGLLMLRDKVAQEGAIHSNATTGGSMLSDYEVLALGRSASLDVLQYGGACGLGEQAQVISNELQSAAKTGKSRSLCAYEICCKALELYSRWSGFGELFYIVNSRLRRVASIRRSTRSEFTAALTDSCGALTDFVRLVWEGLNCEFPDTPRREAMIYRGVELSEAALGIYHDNVGKLFSWSVFSSFTARRECDSRQAQKASGETGDSKRE
jgi:hypothetical protein